jgi:hypothetical protein
MNMSSECWRQFLRGIVGMIRLNFAPLLFACLLVLRGTESPAQDLEGATKPAPDNRVLLMWGVDTTGNALFRFNIYRKPAASAVYPAAPLNATPIGPLKDTTQFSRIIPRGSNDWNTIASALADTVGPGHTLQPLADVYSMTSFPRASWQWRRIQALATAKPAVALVMGEAFVDSQVVNGTAYRYRLVRVGPGNTERPPLGANELTITSGHPGAVPAPGNLRIVIGDAKLQLLWRKPASPYSAYEVFRSNSPVGPFRKVNDVEFSADLTLDIDSVAVSPVANGFTDYEHWDSAGNPSPRTVPGNLLPFTGPANGVKYWYKVLHKDLLGNQSPLSGPVTGTPVDKTPPATPGDIFVDAVESRSGFRIRWTRVRLDVDGHRENVASYTVYRLAQAQNPLLGAVVAVPVVPQPVDTLIVDTLDLSPGLRSACLDSTLFFRVEAKDLAGNISRRSIAVGAALKDTTRPEIVKGATAEGFDDYIRVKWGLNTDCGVDQYLIYRSLCDRGKWYPCPPSKSVTGASPVPPPSTNGRGRDCGGPFVLVGIVPASVAKTLGNPAYFDDHTVPPGSPLCYAYIVKAQDHSQNISGWLPVPLSPPEIIVCERLRDRTPPEPAIVAGLFARDDSIRVDYIGPPVQDIAAYHVYRSDSGQFGNYHWVGGMTVVPPPGTGERLLAPYKPPPQINCDGVPLVSNPYMSAGTFFDRTVERKHIYWYKVLGIDMSGNESPGDSALAISTFTFATNRETPPQIVSVAATDNPCALTLSWTPAYDTSAVKGFFVFRSTTAAGQYYQIEGIQRKNTFADPKVERNTAYFYRVVALRRDGMLTSMSDPMSGVHP